MDFLVQSVAGSVNFRWLGDCVKWSKSNWTRKGVKWLFRLIPSHKVVIVRTNQLAAKGESSRIGKTVPTDTFFSLRITDKGTAPQQQHIQPERKEKKKKKAFACRGRKRIFPSFSAFFLILIFLLFENISNEQHRKNISKAKSPVCIGCVGGPDVMWKIHIKHGSYGSQTHRLVVGCTHSGVSHVGGLLTRQLVNRWTDCDTTASAHPIIDSCTKLIENESEADRKGKRRKREVWETFNVFFWVGN